MGGGTKAQSRSASLNRERAGSAKPTTELRRRITARKGFSVVVWWGALSKEVEKLGRWKAIIGFPSLLHAL
jgi:hypothetical protein